VSNINILSSYDYELPSHLIATKPTMPKENAKLLVFNRQNLETSHLKFGDLATILPPCDIVFNDTRVIKARIFGIKNSGGQIELILNQPLNNGNFSGTIASDGDSAAFWAIPGTGNGDSDHLVIGQSDDAENYPFYRN